MEAVRHLKVALVAEAVLQTVLQALGALEALVVEAVVQAVLQALGPLKVALEALLVEAVLYAVLQAMGPLKVALGATAAANHLQTWTEAVFLQHHRGRDCGHWHRNFCRRPRRPPLRRLHMHGWPQVERVLAQWKIRPTGVICTSVHSIPKPFRNTPTAAAAAADGCRKP